MTTIDVPETVTRRVREKTLVALTKDAEVRFVEYYSIDSDFAGALFLGLEPNEPDRFTVTDLFAVSTLEVSIPARGARRFLVEPTEQDEIDKALRSLPVGPLEKVDDADLVVMQEAYTRIKMALHPHGAKTSNRWVTASKLVARKRPDLFPVRDRMVAGYLEFDKLKTVEQEYAVFRDLMSRADIRERIADVEEGLKKRASGGGLIVESEPLRLLDVALWTYARKKDR